MQRRTLSPFLIIAGVIPAAQAAQAAQAASQDYQIDLGAMPLDHALRRLAALTGRQIIFAPSAISGRMAQPVPGRHSLEGALAILLSGSGLVADATGPVIVVRKSEIVPSNGYRPVAMAAPNVVEDIIITALKQPSILQTTPASVTVLQGDNLGMVGIASFSDIQHQTPAMQLVQNGTTMQRIVLRGVQGFGEATTGVYYDETPVTGPAGSAADPGASQPAVALFDTERIEVLRGPQGTLYGAGSMGGTLRILLNKPDLDDFEGRAEIDALITEGGGEGRSIRGVANLPLVNGKLGVRVAAYDEARGGYIDNVRFERRDINGTSISGGRIVVALQPNNAFRMTLTNIRQSNIQDDAINYWTPTLGAYKTDASIRGEHGDDLTLYNATAILDLPFGVLTATASHYTWDRRSASDYTATLARGVADPSGCRDYLMISQACDSAQMERFQAYALDRIPGAWLQVSSLTSSSQEIRLMSRSNETLRWALGGYAERRRDSFGSFVYRADSDTGAVLAIRGDETGYRTIDNAIRQRAVFGEISWLALPRLDLTAGFRAYDYDTSVGGQVVIPNFLTGSRTTDYQSSTTSARGSVVKLMASYEFRDATLIYLSAAEGFRPGGVNNLPGAGDTIPMTYLPDSLVSYEAGMKSAFLGGRLSAAAAVFQIDWDDMQISTTSSNGAWRFLTNAGAARIRGGEIEFRAQPRPDLLLSATASILDARLVENQSSAAALPTASSGLKGDRIPFTPRYTLSASANYDLPVFRQYAPQAAFNLFWTGSSASEFRQTLETYERQPAYAQVNARISFTHLGARVNLALSNALNDINPVRITSSVNGVRRQTTSLAPRTLSIGLSRRF